MKENLRKGLKYIGTDLTSGSLATLLSYFNAKDITPEGIVGARTMLHGFPSPWLEEVIVSYKNPVINRSLLTEGLLKDIGFWSLISAVPIAAYATYRWYKSRK